MRYAPSSNRLVYVAGLGEKPSAPRVVVRDVGGIEVVLGAGLDPCWLDDQTVLFRDHATGQVRRASAPSWGVTGLGVLANELSASVNGDWLRTLVVNGVPNIHAMAQPILIARAFEPAYSPSGDWFAYRDHASGELRLTDGPQTFNLGPGTRVRWHSQTLVWEWAGRVYGRSTPEQPTVELTIHGWLCSQPICVWDGQQIQVGLVLALNDTRGRLVIAEWGSLLAKASVGRIVGESGESGFAWALSPERAAYLTPAGELVERALSTLPAPTDLRPVVVAPPKPPTDVPFVVTPGAELDVRAALIASATAFANGVVWLHKSSERPNWGEWWDEDSVARWFGHLADQSTGLRLTPDGKESISPEECVARGLDYTTLPLSGYYFEDAKDEATGRPWMPFVFRSGLSVTRTTRLHWHDGRVETVPITISTNVGRGVYAGIEVRGEQWYDPRRVDPSNSKRKAGFVERNFVSVDTPGKFWRRHEYYQDDANGVPMLKGVAMVSTDAARAVAAATRVELGVARWSFHRLLSDEVAA